MLITFTFTGHIALSSVAWVPEFIDRLGVSFATWGTIIGFGVVGSITPLFFVSRLIMRFGPRTLIRFGNYFGAVFLVLLSVTSNPAIWFFISSSGISTGRTTCGACSNAAAATCITSSPN